jgi:ABC-2 type transport system permease protein
MRLKWKLTVASLKMFVRQREAIIWTILLPIFMIVLFGFVDFDGIGRMGIGVVNEAGVSGERVIARLGEVKTVELTTEGRERELKHLRDGERDLVLVIPASFAHAASDGDMEAYVNEASPAGAELALVVVRSVVSDALGRTDQIPQPNVREVRLQGRDLTYIDFLVPGIIAMSIMQMGIFGVAFSFVSLKKRGILRRLSVTPIRPNDFIIGQILMRLLVVLMQISLLVAVGVVFLDLHFTGSVLDMFVTGVLGAFVFLSAGFAIAGISKSEDQVAPIANIVAMPMILLSGVFFSRSGLPGIVHTVTDLLPLTFLADGLRAIAIDGATLSDIVPALTGLAAWCIVSCVVAIYLFRWE